MRIQISVPRVQRRRFSRFSVSIARICLVFLLLLIAILIHFRHSTGSSSSSSAPVVLHKDRSDQHAHEISAKSISLTESYLSSNPPPLSAHLPRSLAHSFCGLHNFDTYAPANASSPPRKVYDLFLLSSELDWLEIRLATLYDVVDYFVILEATMTFTGREKTLLLAREGHGSPGSTDPNAGKNWERIKRFEDKIIYRVLEGMPQHAKRPWDREDWQRNALVKQGLFGLLGDDAAAPQAPGENRREGKEEEEGGSKTKKPALGDVLVVSDVDEIPRPATMVVLRNCAIPRRVTLRSNFYYYGFMWRHRGPEWAHGQATVYAGERDTLMPVELRNGDGGGLLGFWRRPKEKTDIWNAGWHCSTCFERMEEVLRKMGSFSHVSFNQEGFRNKEWIVYCVRAGMDIWNRKGQLFERVEANQDIPELVKTADRFRYLRDRETFANGGFVDYEPPPDQ